LPDLALCDFFLFPEMKLQLKGRRFDTTEEIHAESQEVIDKLTFENFQGCMKSWETHWDRCIHAQGDCFEGDGGN
jgi:histone-lysine N-methyltransferase SETMAR